MIRQKHIINSIPTGIFQMNLPSFLKTDCIRHTGKSDPLTCHLPAWSPDDSSLVRKSRQVFIEIARLHEQDKKVQNLAAVTVIRRVKSDKEKLDELYAVRTIQRWKCDNF